MKSTLALLMTALLLSACSLGESAATAAAVGTAKTKEAHQGQKMIETARATADQLGADLQQRQEQLDRQLDAVRR